MDTKRECIIGGCAQPASIHVSAEARDGLGWRQADVCDLHAERVAKWAVQPFDGTIRDTTRSA